MSYFFQRARLQKAFQNERTAWDESKVTRGKTTPESTPGSFAPSGGASDVMTNKEANANVTDRHFQAGYEDAGRSPFSRPRDNFDTDKQYRMYMAGWQAKQGRSVSSADIPSKDSAPVGEGHKELERSRAYKPPEKIGIGAILRSSWGYGQTNVDYYQVTGMSPSGKTVTLRQLASIDTTQAQRGGSSMSGKKRALPDEFTGKPFQRRIGANGRIKIRDYASASLWDGADNYYSWDH